MLHSDIADVLVIGAGIVGCSHALAAARAGLRVTLVERAPAPADASVRNFGYVASVVGGAGTWGQRAVRSRAIYEELAAINAIPMHVKTGGMQVAQTAAELAVLQEFAASAPSAGFNVELLSPEDAARRNPVLRPDSIAGALLFRDDGLLEPRALFEELIPYLQRELGVTYRPRTAVVRLQESPAGDGVVIATTAGGDEILARHAYLCAGADVSTLFPSFFASLPPETVHLVKLQMLRLRLPAPLATFTPITSPQSLLRYPAFTECASFGEAERAAAQRDAAFNALGVHVIVRPAGRLRTDAFGTVEERPEAGVEGGGVDPIELQHDEVIVGDSHQVVPLDGAARLSDTLSEAVTAEILRCASAFAHGMVREHVISQWSGVYMRCATPEGVINVTCRIVDGGRSLVEDAERGRVTGVTGLGGRGMTMSPALAEESIATLRARQLRQDAAR